MSSVEITKYQKEISELSHKKETPPSNIGKIYLLCGLAASFIYGVMNWAAYTREDQDLLALEPTTRAVKAAYEVDIYRNELDLSDKLLFPDAYLGALKHDTRETERK